MQNRANEAEQSSTEQSRAEQSRTEQKPSSSAPPTARIRRRTRARGSGARARPSPNSTRPRRAARRSGRARAGRRRATHHVMNSNTRQAAVTLSCCEGSHSGYDTSSFRTSMMSRWWNSFHSSAKWMRLIAAERRHLRADERESTLHHSQHREPRETRVCSLLPATRRERPAIWPWRAAWGGRAATHPPVADRARTTRTHEPNERPA